jgi:hypothetical protein
MGNVSQLRYNNDFKEMLYLLSEYVDGKTPCSMPRQTRYLVDIGFGESEWIGVKVWGVPFRWYGLTFPSINECYYNCGYVIFSINNVNMAVHRRLRVPAFVTKLIPILVDLRSKGYSGSIWVDFKVDMPKGSWAVSKTTNCVYVTLVDCRQERLEDYSLDSPDVVEYKNRVYNDHNMHEIYYF